MNLIRGNITALLIGLLTPGLALAADPVAKVRDIRHDRAVEGLTVVFCARDSPGATGLPGHAYVVLGHDDPARQVCTIEAFGFQPANDGDRGIVKGVPGTVVEPYLKDSKKPLPGVCRITFQVDRTQFAAVEAVRKKWSDHEYRLSGSNCIDFAAETVRALDSDLKLPERSTLQRPHRYIRQLAEQN